MDSAERSARENGWTSFKENFRLILKAESISKAIKGKIV